MKYVYITPCKDCLLAELREKASPILRNIIKSTPWMKWEKRKDVNGKGRMQWYIVVDTTADKEERIKKFAELMCGCEGYAPWSRICPHDLYYEDMHFFSEYAQWF